MADGLNALIAGRVSSRMWAVAAIISIVLLALVVSRIDVAALRRLLQSARLEGLAFAFASTFVIYLVTTVRLLRSFTGNTTGAFATACDIGVLHSALLVLLPARLGDAYYPVLVAQRMKTRLGVAIANLILLRALDALAVAMLFLASAYVVIGGTSGTLGNASAIYAAAAAVALVCIATMAALPTAMRCVARVSYGYRTHKMAAPVLRHATAAARWLRTHSTGRRAELFGYTVIAWAANATTFWLLFWTLGVTLTVPATVFVAAGFSLAAALPLQTVGGFGVAEASLSILLAATGMPIGEAAAVAVMTRLCLLLQPLLIAALWFGPRQLQRQTRAGA